jgi:hypothetical protein
MMIKPALAVATALCSIIAAALWWYASWVEVSPARADELRKEEFERTGQHRRVALAFTADADLDFTLAAQSRWNRRAAVAAGFAAIFQAAYVAVSEFGA